nr:zinc-binding alcohol dehydrogenase [Dissulfurirhabdus thermomarina]
METAVTLVLDGRPFLGARVVVFGLGVVGLLATALLARFPLEVLAGIDPAPLRRKIAREAGAHAVFPPPEARPGGALLERLGAGGRTAGADLVLETSGVPEALDAAVGVAGFSGTVVVGSWYGTRRVSLDLGSAFHRRRLRLVSSQVSTLAPEATGRWSRNRRTGTTWEWIRRLQPGRYLTHRFPLEAAPEAYEFLRGGTGEALQVALVHQG